MNVDWIVNLDRRTAESTAGALVFHPVADGNFWIAATAVSADLAVTLASASAAIAAALQNRREVLQRLARPAPTGG
jgi:hypothetical protein